MPPSLHEDRVGDNGADGCKCDRARDRVFRTIKQNAHHETAFGGLFSCSRAAATTAWSIAIQCNCLRHFSSPDGFGAGSALLEPASQCCSAADPLPGE